MGQSPTVSQSHVKRPLAKPRRAAVAVRGCRRAGGEAPRWLAEGQPRRRGPEPGLRVLSRNGSDRLRGWTALRQPPGAEPDSAPGPCLRSARALPRPRAGRTGRPGTPQGPQPLLGGRRVIGKRGGGRGNAAYTTADRTSQRGHRSTAMQRGGTESGQSRRRAQGAALTHQCRIRAGQGCPSAPCTPAAG